MGEGRGIYSVAMFHVAADDISFAATFCKSHFSLILSQLVSASKPMVLKLIFGFEADFCFLASVTSLALTFIHPEKSQVALILLYFFPK